MSGEVKAACFDGAPAPLPFAVCCQLAGVEAGRSRLRLRQAAQDPEGHRDALRRLCRRMRAA